LYYNNTNKSKKINMKIIISVFLMLVLIQTSRAQTATAKKIDSLIQAYVDLNKFNGSILVARGGKILLQKGYGLKNVVQQTKNDKNTIFQIGSITKEFTATIILQLAEQKKLSLDDKLSKYYPGFPKADSITIINLLTHTSGISDYTHVPYFLQQSEKHTDEHQILDTLQNRPFDFSPGQKYSYSNSGYMLLAFIIQKICGQPYEAVIRQRIFIPAHMQNSGFNYTGLISANKAAGYTEFSAAETEEGPAIDSSQFIGSGEIYSTVGDLYKWNKALQENKFISSRILQQAYQPFKGQYGYGWELDTAFGKTLVGHSGGMFGFRSKMTRVVQDDIFIVLLANESDDPYLQTITKDVLAILYKQHYTLPFKPLHLNADEINAYTGKYAFDEKHAMVVMVIDGHIFATSPNGKRMELLPLKNLYFRWMEREGEEGDIIFEKDEKGIVNKMIINEHGDKLIATRAK
jgi:CubicO group peptidase (beta-lactamase class C family)